MASENKISSNQKKVKTVWAIIAIVVIALVAGGIIYFYANNSELQDDIYSVSLTSPVQIHREARQKATATDLTKLPNAVKK